MPVDKEIQKDFPEEYIIVYFLGKGLDLSLFVTDLTKLYIQ